MIWGSQKFARYYQARKESSDQDAESETSGKDEVEKCAA